MQQNERQQESKPAMDIFVVEGIFSKKGSATEDSFHGILDECVLADVLCDSVTAFPKRLTAEDAKRLLGNGLVLD